LAHNRQLGIKGEQQAVEFLRQAGYEILETNWRWKRCEVDIIAQHDGILIFAEVKTRTSTAFGMPEESVSQAKQDKLAEAAEAYIEQINHRGEIRFDIIAIVVSGTKNELLHLKDAFFPS
jgi:putative endonuclease